MRSPPITRRDVHTTSPITGCGVIEDGKPCAVPASRVLAQPADRQFKRHMVMCETHRNGFKNDFPLNYKRRIDLSFSEWRDYALNVYGGLPVTCKCAACRLVS